MINDKWIPSLFIAMYLSHIFYIKYMHICITSMYVMYIHIGYRWMVNKNNGDSSLILILLILGEKWVGYAWLWVRSTTNHNKELASRVVSRGEKDFIDQLFVNSEFADLFWIPTGPLIPSRPTPISHLV
jgi:hypothetical protein